MSLLDSILRKSHLSANKEKIARNVFWAVVGKVVNMLGSLFVGILVARYLGPEQYGLMNYVISFVAIFQVFAYFGLDDIEVREEARKAEEAEVVIGTALVLKLVLALVAFALIVATVFLTKSDGYTRWIIILYAFSVFFNTSGVVRNYFTSIVWNEYIVKTEISRTLIGVAFKLILFFLHASLTWFVFAMLFDSVLLASGYYIAYKKKIGRVSRWTFDRQKAYFLLRQGFPLLLSGAAIVIYQRIDQLMIGDMIDNASVGFFSVAVRFVEVFLFIPVMLTQTIVPVLVKIRNTDEERYRKNAQLFMNVTVWLCILLSVVISLLARPLVTLTFGEAYIPAVSVLQILVFKMIGMSLSQTSGQMIIIENKQKYVVFRNLAGCVVCIGLNLVLIPRYGICGSALVTVVTVLVSGWLIHLLIPPYRKYFTYQLKAIFLGWKSMFQIKQLVR